MENGLKHGAIGVLNTDWGDRGHWQPLPVSYLGFAYGAALSWAYAPNVDLDLPAVLNTFAFRDKAGIMGRVVYDLGNAYQQPGILMHNGSLLFWIYQAPLDEMGRRVVDSASSRHRSKITNNCGQICTPRSNTSGNLMTQLDQTEMAVPDAALIKREFANAAQMLRHGARRALLYLDDPGMSKSGLAAEIDAIEVGVPDAVAGAQPSRRIGGQRRAAESGAGVVRGVDRILEKKTNRRDAASAEF